MSESYLHIIKEELDNPDVIEIIANADGKLWIETHKKGMFFTGKTLRAQEREIFLRIVASKNKKKHNPNFPFTFCKNI